MQIILSYILTELQPIILLKLSPNFLNLGEFNAKSNPWFKSDNTTYEGSKIDGVTSTFGLQQIINESTHIIGDSSSCIDLKFTSKPNLVMQSGMHSSLHLNCHHQVTYAKFSLKIYYPPPCERAIWHYEKANVYHIRRSIDEFSWERCFANSSVKFICLLKLFKM